MYSVLSVSCLSDFVVLNKHVSNCLLSFLHMTYFVVCLVGPHCEFIYMFLGTFFKLKYTEVKSN